MHFGLSSKEYEQVLSFIKESNLAEDQLLHLYPSQTGELCISLSKKGVSADGGDANQKLPSAPKGDEPSKAAKQTQGNYLVASMQPGNFPYIQCGTTDRRLVFVMSMISILCGATCLTWQICSIVFGIQDRKRGRADRDGNASNALSN